jgi:hypothetical protein
MASLTGSSVATTYDQLLTLPSGGGNTTTLVALTDGDGVNTFCLQLATTKAMIEGNGSTLYFFDEGGESISADNAGVLSIAGGAEIDITTPTVDINASTAVTVDGPSVAISSTSASEPVLHITNTHAGATAGEIRFNKDSASGDDNDVMGTISWYGTDAGENTHQKLAYIDSIITDSAAGSEAASMRFYVAENDGTNTLGLTIAGQADDDAEVDVTIGAGAGSTATVAGDLTVTGDQTLSGDLIMADGKGIDFQNDASPAAGMTAEILDDYETGTWDAVVTDGTRPMSMTIDGGYYTKVGNLVTVSGYFVTDSLDGGSGNATGNIRITGLPFAIANNNAAHPGGGAAFGVGLAITAGHSVSYYGGINGTNIYLYVWGDAGGVLGMQASEWSADGQIILGFSYRAA